jgi:hypothetical protein
MLLQQCRSGDSPIEPRIVWHRRSNVTVDGVGGDNDRPWCTSPVLSQLS